MKSLLFAEFTEFLDFQALLGVLLVLSALVIQVMADGTLEVDEMVLGHKRDIRFKI